MITVEECKQALPPGWVLRPGTGEAGKFTWYASKKYSYGPIQQRDTGNNSDLEVILTRAWSAECGDITDGTTTPRAAAAY